MTIELAKNKNWFYRLVSTNGETLMTSETYKTKWNAKRAARKIARLNGFEYAEVV